MLLSHFPISTKILLNCHMELLKKYRQRATATACAVNICKPPVGAD